MPLETNDELKELLSHTKTVAVLGASDDEDKPGNQIPRVLANDYRLIPVNPRLEGQILFGERVRKSLDEIDEDIDLIDVFRRNETLKDHADEIVALSHRPKAVWFQSGLRDPEATRVLEDAGVEVVEDRCLMVAHRTLMRSQ